ncbi:hypothetical protein [Caloranaerobacter sp. DY30410]|uniref:hypothetical protein n=1 Tax=Caloranaerobacter sp. DY30410 TaxID=3238305 RepID=UPI003CFC2A90
MLKNNLKVLLYHCVIIIISFCLCFPFLTMLKDAKEIYVPILHGLWVLFFAFLYILAGLKLDIENPPKYDFLSVSILVIINAALILTMYIVSAGKMLLEDEIYGIYRAPIGIFNFPFQLSILQLYLPYLIENLIIRFLIIMWLPSLFMFIGIKLKRRHSLV